MRQGWQHEASSRKEQLFKDEFFTRVPQQVALVWGRHPTNRETTIPSHLFRVVLLRRLRQPSVSNCRCGRLFDVCGHHRAVGTGGDAWSSGFCVGKCSSEKLEEE